MQQRKHKGILGTIGFHLAVLVILIFFGLNVPLPLPEEEGILLDFGTDETGYGTAEPMQNEATQSTEQQTPQEETAPSPASTQSENPAMTQDYEEAPALKPEQPDARKNEVTENRKDTREEEKKQEQKKAEEQRKVNERALFPGKSSSEGSQEGITEGPGNQGSEAGETGANNYQTGEFGGGGIEYSLTGRNPVSLPAPEYNYQEEGIVRVEITVNRNGEVINAVPGVKGSTTLDSYLLEMAKKAALKARFTNKSDGSVYQKGTITYHFILE